MYLLVLKSPDSTCHFVSSECPFLFITTHNQYRWCFTSLKALCSIPFHSLCTFCSFCIKHFGIHTYVCLMKSYLFMKSQLKSHFLKKSSLSFQSGLSHSHLCHQFPMTLTLIGISYYPYQIFHLIINSMKTKTVSNHFFDRSVT